MKRIRLLLGVLSVAFIVSMNFVYAKNEYGIRQAMGSKKGMPYARATKPEGTDKEYYHHENQIGTAVCTAIVARVEVEYKIGYIPTEPDKYYDTVTEVTRFYGFTKEEVDSKVNQYLNSIYEPHTVRGTSYSSGFVDVQVTNVRCYPSGKLEECKTKNGECPNAEYNS